MIKASEHLPFAAKALLALKSDPTQMQELDGNGGFESIVHASGTPNATHATSPDFRLDDIRANVASNQRRADDLLAREEWLRQKLGIASTLALGKRIGNRGGELGFTLREFRQPTPRGPAWANRALDRGIR